MKQEYAQRAERYSHVEFPWHVAFRESVACDLSVNPGWTERIVYTHPIDSRIHALMASAYVATGPNKPVSIPPAGTREPPLSIPARSSPRVGSKASPPLRQAHMHSGSRLTGILRRYSNRSPGHPNRPPLGHGRLCHRHQDFNATPGGDRRHRQPAPGAYLVSRRRCQAQPGTGYRDLRHPRGDVPRHGGRCGRSHGGPRAERVGALGTGQRRPAADQPPRRARGRGVVPVVIPDRTRSGRAGCGGVLGGSSAGGFPSEPAP